MGLNEVTAGMTPQEKEIYFAHMEKRHREEAEKIRLEKERTRAYKESLIQDILAKGLNHNQYTEEQLRGKSISKVKEFVRLVSAHNADTELRSGRFVVDAKSIMGIFSLNISEPVEMRVCGDEDDIEKLEQDIKQFIES